MIDWFEDSSRWEDDRQVNLHTIVDFFNSFILKNIIRIIKPENTNHLGFFPNITFVNNSDVKKIELDDLTYFESVKMCGYGYSLCTHYVKQKLKSKKYFNYKVIISD